MDMLGAFFLALAIVTAAFLGGFFMGWIENERRK